MKTPGQQSWNQFIQSSALSYYVAPQETSAAVERCSRDYYWHHELLEKWSSLTPTIYDANEKSRVSTITYGSYMWLASLLAENLSRRLSLVILDNTAERITINQCNDAVVNSSLRVGIAIPEGPFLPLFILVVHSLNVAVAEDWLTFGGENRMCKGVVLIPLETDEAPERLKHILCDSSPNLILVAPGKDWESMENANECKPASTASVELVDYTQLIEEALSSLQTQMQQHNDSCSLMEQLWPQEIRNDSLDSLRYSHAIPGCFDVARLVALGMVRLRKSSFSPEAHLKSNTSPSKREIISHIVYTSGTTGKPKGCVSSLASLQHYICAKNLAHDIDRSSRVLLASAITFDPCFSDVLATCAANAVLCIAPRERLYSHVDDSSEDDGQDGHRGLTKLLGQLEITHVLCTPTLWATVEGNPPENVPSLKVVALGGEPIPKSMVGKWARGKIKDEFNRQYPRLCATYGVTEACVYQTFGEVTFECNEDDAGSSNNIKDDKSMRPGLSVGLPLLGNSVHICHPHSEVEGFCDHQLQPVEHDEKSTESAIGEVVLAGEQVDGISSYLNLPELSARVFVKGCEDGAGLASHFYRTGDLGYIETTTGNLHLLGRIKGDGMVKINGIRIELAEIENAIVDDALASNEEEGSLVVDCMAAVTTNSTNAEDVDSKQLIAYCVLSAVSILQLGIPPEQLKHGVIIPPGPLLSLLRARCDRRVRRGCTLSFFVLIDRLPLSPTGKRNRKALPPLAECSLPSTRSGSENDSLWSYGTIGPFLAGKICECLNLQPCQRQLVTRDANFFLLGGDSLAATRVVRGLYAQYHGILDSRNLGGESGTLDGPFAVIYLIQSDTLGDYVAFLESRLDTQSTFEGKENDVTNHDAHQEAETEKKTTDPLYGSLIEAITVGHTSIASALLDLGVDPNSEPNEGRLGKNTDRKQQRNLFKSNPLHLACLRGNSYLVKRLLSKGCKCNTPNATGSFPIHLACSRLEDKGDDSKEDLNRLQCVKLLLERTPISIKDGNKQTILHSAARSGHVELLKYILNQWRIAAETTGMKFKSNNNVPGRIYDWYDRWFRTPVHWAVLNGRTKALQILLDGGCSAFPPKPKSGVSKRTTNVIIETPLEMCLRLYGDTSEIGKEISCLLKNAEY